MQTFYFLSLLQKLAAPKEFMLGEEQLAALIDADGSETFLNPFLGHTTGIVPLGRIAVADDIARVVLFAMSDLGQMMTGGALYIDGGDLVF